MKSSYSHEIEADLEKNADDVPDTLQWWFGNAASWQIRTYALDHDIHAYQVANPLQTSLTLEIDMRCLSKRHVEATAVFPTVEFLNAIVNCLGVRRNRARLRRLTAEESISETIHRTSVLSPAAVNRSMSGSS